MVALVNFYFINGKFQDRFVRSEDFHYIVGDIRFPQDLCRIKNDQNTFSLSQKHSMIRNPSPSPVNYINDRIHRLLLILVAWIISTYALNSVRSGSTKPGSTSPPSSVSSIVIISTVLTERKTSTMFSVGYTNHSSGVPASSSCSTL